jgi:hypothetical protein
MSDPQAINVPISQALTSDMMLGLKPCAPKSRSARVSIAPINKSIFSGGDVIQIEIPSGRKNSWLDPSQSYLKFSVQVSTTVASPATAGSGGVYIENSAYSFISKLDVWNGSNLLESINEYGQLANFLIDTSLTQSDKAGLSPMIGTNNINYYQNGPVAYGQNQPVTQTQQAGDRSGLQLQTTTAINTSIPYTFVLPLLSGVVGVNSSKCLPIGKLNAPIRLDLYVEQNDNAIVYGLSGAGAIWQIVNVEFCACFVEIQDDNFDVPLAQGQPEYISTTTYRQSSAYLPAATSGEFTTLLPFRCASLKALYGRFRHQSTAVQGATATQAYRKSSSISPNLNSYYFRCGNSVYPNKPVYLLNGYLTGTGAEAYGELLKSFHSLSSSIGNTAITFNQYNVAATASQGFAAAYGNVSKGVALDTANNAFAIGIELESFSNRSDTILSGISTLNSQCFFTGIINSGSTAGGANNYNYTVDFFAQMDMILVLVDGILTAKF